jgi:hypothetical protein
VLMPKAAMHEDDFPQANERQIWLTREFAPV